MSEEVSLNEIGDLPNQLLYWTLNGLPEQVKRYYKNEGISVQSFLAMSRFLTKIDGHITSAVEVEFAHPTTSVPVHDIWAWVELETPLEVANYLGEVEDIFARWELIEEDVQEEEEEEEESSGLRPKLDLPGA